MKMATKKKKLSERDADSQRGADMARRRREREKNRTVTIPPVASKGDAAAERKILDRIRRARPPIPICRSSNRMPAEMYERLKTAVMAQPRRMDGQAALMILRETLGGLIAVIDLAID